jgi:hypothetical protein
MTVEVMGFAAVMVALLLLMAALSGWVSDRRGTLLRRLRDDLSDGALILLGLLALGWLVLFMLVGAAAITGTLQLASDPGAGGLGFGALLVGLLGAPFLVWGTVIRQTTLDFQREGHVTDRISKAVEQLGAEKTVKLRGKDAEGKDVTIEESKPNIEVRIGGILSLERIAQDSTRHDRGRDHVRCMEILCAYVRENAPASGVKRNNPRDIWETALESATKELEPDIQDAAELALRAAELAQNIGGISPINLRAQVARWLTKLPGPREDIALAMKVIGRRDAAQRRVEARWGKDAAPDAEWVFDVPCPMMPDHDDGTARPKGELDAYLARLEAWRARTYGYAGYRLDLRNINLQKLDLPGSVVSGALMGEVRFEGANLAQARISRRRGSRAGADGGSRPLEDSD